MRLELSISEAEALANRLRELRHQIDLMELEWAAGAAGLAGTGYHELQGSQRASDFLRHHCGMGEGAVKDRMAVGCYREVLPESVQALCGGEIGFPHLVQIAHTASAVRRSCGPDHPFDERRLVERARTESVGRFWHTCQNYLHACCPDHFADAAEELFEQRELTIRRRRDGAYTFWGRLDPTGAAVVKTALAPLARRRGKEDNRSFKQRLHDALVEHAAENQQTHLNVTVAVETLLALQGAPAAEIEGMPPIAQRTVERLACDCSVRRILLDPKSNVIEVGRSRRVISTPARRGLIARQGGLCGWPGCDRQGRIAHHVEFWNRGGSSDLPNQVLVCYFHHRMLHEGGWQMIVKPEGEIMVLRPPPTFAYLARGPDLASAA
jgi:Domain of unknown function (DUF222)